MLRWTSAGAVTGPTTVQIRLERTFSDRVRAGAPAPTRSLTDEEIRDNLHYFSVTQRGPRSRPATALVLSGVRARPGLSELLQFARSSGILRITLHLSAQDVEPCSAVIPLVDALAITVQRPESVAAISGVATPVSAILLLQGDGPSREMVEALSAARPARVVFTWPYPPIPAGPIDRVLPALRAAAFHLANAGISVGIKGIPLCLLGDLHGLTARSQNRWYVDAEHQREGALLFFPDVVRLAKGDVCRFCSLEPRCDGVAEAWMRAGLVPPLRAQEFSSIGDGIRR